MGERAMMNKDLRGLILMLAVTSAMATPALAQQAVFRVPMTAAPAASTLDPVYSWIESAGACSTTCGTGTRITSYQCQDITKPDFTVGGYGAPEADASCVASAGAKPSDTSATCINYSGCGFDWVRPAPVVTPVPIGGNPLGRDGCGQVKKVFSPFCQRTDGTVMAAGDHSLCKGDLPDYNDVAAGTSGSLGYDVTSIDTSQCNQTDHDWVIGGWSAWSSQCSATANRTRSVVCVRRFDGSTQADSACGGPKPATSETSSQMGGCGFHWEAGSWSGSSSTCSATATQTRSVTCRQGDGTLTADANCTGPKPNSAQTLADYSGCTYQWAVGGWSAPDSTCSASATQTRAVWCARSDGTSVGDSYCSDPKPATATSGPDYSSCGYSWQTGAWSAWSSMCSSTATQTRSVTCLRADGTTVGDGSCVSAKPAAAQTAAQYGGCAYATSYGGWSACSSGTQSRSVTCTRSDGATVGSSACGFAGDPTSQSQACVSAPSATCGNPIRFAVNIASSPNPDSAAVQTSASYQNPAHSVSDIGYGAARITDSTGATDYLYVQCVPNASGSCSASAGKVINGQMWTININRWQSSGGYINGTITAPGGAQATICP